MEIETDRKLPFDARKIAELVIETSLDYVKCPYETEVSLLLTTDEEIKEINLKLDGNRYVYEIDGFDKSKEYEMTINARTGKEIKSSSEKLDLDEHLQKGLDLDKTISRKEASEIAEKEVKNSVAKEWDLKMEDGKAIWEVTVESGSTKHEVEIDASSKKVIRSEED